MKTDRSVFGDFQKKQPLLTASKGKSPLPKGFGVDLMRRINDGLIQAAPKEHVEKVRSLICENCEELIVFGARIRPLIVEGRQVGWVRGVHQTERKLLQKWLYNAEDRVTQILQLGTSLTAKEIINLSSLEVRSLVSLIRFMSDYDITLFPYLSAFVSSMTSENMWHGLGTKPTSFENKEIRLPDGKTMRVLLPSDHAKLWATLCTYREQAKARLDSNFNAVMILRPWAGKSADPISADLRAVSRRLQTDSLEPWLQVVRAEDKGSTDDGWAHPEDTPEGLVRELKGMLSHDKHEQVIEAFEKRQREEAEDQKRRIDALIAKKDGLDISDEIVEVISEAEANRLEKELRKGIRPLPPEAREVVQSPKEKIKRYM